MRAVSGTVGTVRPNGTLRVRRGANLVLHDPDSGRERPRRCVHVESVP